MTTVWLLPVHLRPIGAQPSGPSIATAAGFRMDVDGDGRIDEFAEVFDLTLVGGADGTLQFLRSADGGTPQVFSVVRLPGAILGVRIDAAQDLARVGLGALGVALVDLRGPASVQPIDLDRDGVDDRFLGLVDTPGTAGAVSVGGVPGTAAVADGAAGLTAAQVEPYRVRILDLRRDPVLSTTRDEESILESRRVLATDAAVVVVVESGYPPDIPLTLTAEEVPAAAGQSLVGLPGGVPAVAVPPGRSDVVLRVLPGARGQVHLRVLTPDGRSVASTSFAIVSAEVVESALIGLEVTPATVRLSLFERSMELSVGARYANGQYRNVSRAIDGTTYESSNLAVAEVRADGLVVARAGGRAVVTVRHGGLTSVARVEVSGPAAPTSIEMRVPYVTLTGLGQSSLLDVFARLTDGRLERAAPLATFTSSDPSVATVDAEGRVTAIGPGVADILVAVGGLERRVLVAVEPRVTPTFTSLTLATPDAPVPSDLGELTLNGRAVGTGSVQDVAVTALVDGRTVETRTGYDGSFALRLTGLSTPGTFPVAVSLRSPADGVTLAASTVVEVVLRGRDAEPNDDLAAAVEVVIRPVRTPIVGSVGGTDARDAYRVVQATAGTMTARVKLPEGVDATGLVVRLLGAAGDELARGVAQGRGARVTGTVPRGDVYVEVGGALAPVEYELTLDFVQAPIAVSSVEPTAGGPGTIVTVAGSGFDTTPGATRVYFGGVQGEVTSVTSARVVAVVPQLAVDGPVRVISGTRRAEGGAFSVGRAGPPESSVRQVVPAALRFDPLDANVVDISRVAVFVTPSATAEQVRAVAASVGAVISGVVEAVGCHFFAFPAHRTLEDLGRTIDALQASPIVRLATSPPVAEVSITIDGRTLASALPAAFNAVRAYEALSLVRRTPPFNLASGFGPAVVAVIDSGFRPLDPSDYTTAAGTSVVEVFAPNAAGVFVPSGPVEDGTHGTAVTSIIAALNDGNSPLSGTLGGAFTARENPPAFARAFAAGIAGDPRSIDLAEAVVALATISAMGDVDAVNLSFASEFVTDHSVMQARAFWTPVLELLAGRTLVVVAASNSGTDATYTTPASLSLTMPHVLTVGATAAINTDGTGETGDVRAVFDGSIPLLRQHLACDPNRRVAGSNCGAPVGLAATGEDFMVSDGSGQPGAQPISYGGRGTSFAAPLVAGAAGLIQALQGVGGVPLSPVELKLALIDTADDISATWRPGSMARLNMLESVRPFLPPALFPQRILVADEEATVVGAGALIGLDASVDSTEVNLQPAMALSLSATIRGQAFQATRPTSIVVSPVGGEAYLLVRSVSPDLGDGLLVFDTLFEEFTDFIAFSGAPLLPAPGLASAAFPPVTVPDARTPMVVTRDGRLLYAAVGLRLLVVNLPERRIVRSFADLPAPYNAMAPNYAAAELDTRLADLVVAANRVGAPATKFSALALSADGTELYVAVQAGSGPGLQPGRLLPVDVGLYLDDDPQTAGLQSDLATYMTSPGAVAMTGAGSAAGDEPSAVAVDDRFGFAYLVTGGLDGYDIVPPDPQQISLTRDIFGEVTVQDLAGLTDVGGTLIRARGFTGVFNINGGSPAQELAFPSEVNFGWNSSARLVTQFNPLKRVLAKRPMGMALRTSDSSRALVSFFQTGNFGVLDLNGQAGFTAPPVDGVPRPILSSLSGDQFQGLVGVTESLQLDTHLWPRRGRLPLGGSNYVPSPDEALLFAGPIVYAQNGRFAVASHAGVGRSQTIAFTMPSFQTPQLAAGLAELGIPYEAGKTVQLNRRGGAISIIDDRAIDVALLRSSQSVPSDGKQRPALAVSPLCTFDATGCSRPVTTALLDYARGPGDRVRFERPRGVAIQPFAYIETPRHRDHIVLNSLVQVEWRDAEVSEVGFRVLDMDAPRQPLTVGAETAALTPVERRGRLVARSFSSLLLPGVRPVPGHRYAIEASLLKPDSFGRVAFERIEVVFDDVGQRLRLTPELSFIAAAPGGNRQLSVFLTKIDGSVEDVTSSAQYEFIGAGLTEAGVPGFAAARAQLQQALGLPQGTVVGIADISVSASGVVSAQTPGVQVIRATHPDAAGPSNVTVLLVGFDLHSIVLEPSAPLTAQPTPIVDQFLMAEQNAPLILAPLPGAFARDHGLASLHRVFFHYMGVGRTSASDVFDFVTAALNDLTFVSGDSQAIDEMLARAEALVIGPPPMQFTAREPFIATLGCPPGVPDPGPYATCVRSVGDGLGLVGGRLDLNSIDLGAASDDLLVLVLPPVASGEIQPQPLVIDRRTPAEVGPSIRTSACLAPLRESFARPVDYPDTAAFVSAWLPSNWSTGGTVVSLQGFGGFEFSLRTTLAPLTFSVDYSVDRLCFSVPTDPTPGIVDQGVQQVGPQLVSVVRQSAYDRQLRHRDLEGETTLAHTFTLDGLGSATATARLVVCGCAWPPGGGAPVITELNLTPQRDWNDSSGGNGVPFDAVPGDGAVTPDDVWVEVHAGTTATTAWQVRLTDSSGATFTKPIGLPTTTTRTRLLVDWGLGASPVVRVDLVDQNGAVRQTLDIQAIEQALGPATGAGDETLAWSITGTPSPTLQQFVRRPATINVFAPF